MKKLTLLRVAALALLVLLASSAVPCRSAAAGETSLYLRGEPGDYIVGDQQLYFSSSEGEFSALKNAANGVPLSFNTPDYSQLWFLEFAPPNEQILTQGLYSG